MKKNYVSLLNRTLLLLSLWTKLRWINPGSIQQILYDFVDLIASSVYDSSAPEVQKFVDNEFISVISGPGRNNIITTKSKESKTAKIWFSGTMKTFLMLFLSFITKITAMQTNVLLTDTKRNKDEVIGVLTAQNKTISDQNELF